jgi:hypothetical protein
MEKLHLKLKTLFNTNWTNFFGNGRIAASEFYRAENNTLQNADEK